MNDVYKIELSKEDAEILMNLLNLNMAFVEEEIRQDALRLYGIVQTQTGLRKGRRPFNDRVRE